MSLAPSLRNRVAKLEQLVGAGPRTDRAKQMHRLRTARLAMTLAERAEHAAQHAARCIASLNEYDAPFETVEEQAQRMRRSRGRRLLAARMAESSSADASAHAARREIAVTSPPPRPTTAGEQA